MVRMVQDDALTRAPFYTFTFTAYVPFVGAQQGLFICAFLLNSPTTFTEDLIEQMCES